MLEIQRLDARAKSDPGRNLCGASGTLERVHRTQFFGIGVKQGFLATGVQFGARDALGLLDRLLYHLALEGGHRFLDLLLDACFGVGAHLIDLGFRLFDDAFFLALALHMVLVEQRLALSLKRVQAGAILFEAGFGLFAKRPRLVEVLQKLGPAPLEMLRNAGAGELIENPEENQQINNAYAPGKPIKPSGGARGGEGRLGEQQQRRGDRHSDAARGADGTAGLAQFLCSQLHGSIPISICSNSTAALTPRRPGRKGLGASGEDAMIIGAKSGGPYHRPATSRGSGSWRERSGLWPRSGRAPSQDPAESARGPRRPYRSALGGPGFAGTHARRWRRGGPGASSPRTPRSRGQRASASQRPPLAIRRRPLHAHQPPLNRGETA